MPLSTRPLRRLKALACLAVPCLFTTTAYCQVTESPATVAKGKVLMEMDAWSLACDKADGVRIRDCTWAAAIFTTGVAENLDVQLGVQAHRDTKVDDGVDAERTRGFGDLFVRAKWAFYTPEKSIFSAALLPYVKLPTNSGRVGNHHVEGGLIVPIEAALPYDFTGGVNAQADVVHDDVGSSYHLDWSGTAYLGHPIAGKLSGYGEAIVIRPHGGSSETYLGGGLVYAFSEKISVDYEFLAGVNEIAADTSHTLRLNWEF